MHKGDCSRCGAAWETTAFNGPSTNKRPPEGKYAVLQVSWKEAHLVCPACWDLSLSEGFDLTKLEDRKRWGAVDWDSPERVAAQEEAKEERASKIAELEDVIRGIKVMTFTPSRPFEVIGPVFGVGSSEAADEMKFVSEMLGVVGIRLGAQGSPPEAFQSVVSSLSVSCAELGGEAVVGASFEHRISLASGSGITGALGRGPKHQAVEIWGYGTAVKWTTEK